MDVPIVEIENEFGKQIAVKADEYTENSEYADSKDDHIDVIPENSNILLKKVINNNNANLNDYANLKIIVVEEEVPKVIS